jgi:hypothetical protein
MAISGKDNIRGLLFFATEVLLAADDLGESFGREHGPETLSMPTYASPAVS